MAKFRTLSRSDLQLWAAYSQSVALLPGKTRVAVEAEPVVPAPAAPQEINAPKLKPEVRPVDLNAAPAGLDKASWKHFSSGKIRAERRLDLHGYTAARAHHAATHFIERAYAGKIRCVEIITGKGEVLARELPLWLNAPALRHLVLAIVHPHAANTGSVRILLRRVRAPEGNTAAQHLVKP